MEDNLISGYIGEMDITAFDNQTLKNEPINLSMYNKE